jgi:hypothetical protein
MHLRLIPDLAFHEENLHVARADRIAVIAVSATSRATVVITTTSCLAATGGAVHSPADSLPDIKFRSGHSICRSDGKLSLVIGS